MADITNYLKYTSLVYTQYYLHNAKNNNNSENNFLLDVDLSSVFPYRTMDLRIMLNFTLKTIDL